MTFAAALRYKPGCAITAIDSKVTWPSGHVEYSRKGEIFGPGVILEIGDGSETLKMRNEIFSNEPKKEKGKKNLPGYNEFLDTIRIAYKTIYSQRAEDEILSQYNLDWKKFELGKFPNQIVPELTSSIKSFREKYDAELMYCAYGDDKEDVHIVSVKNDGLDLYENFYSTGATDTPDKIFTGLTSENKIEINLTDAQAMLVMLEALHDVDKNIYVGGRALVFYVDQSGPREVKKETVNACGEIFNKNKDKDAALREIEEVLKADKK